MTRSRTGASLRRWSGPIVGLLIVVPALAAAWATDDTAYTVPFAAPLLDTMTITCLLVTAVICGLDALASRTRQPLALMALTTSLAIGWALHLAVFPGVVPRFNYPLANQLTSSAFLVLNLFTPVFLIVTLLIEDRSVGRPGWALLLAAAVGVAGGIALSAMSVVLALTMPTVDRGGAFNGAATLLGGLAAIPSLIGLFLVYGRGYRPDERQSPGITAAFVFEVGVAVAMPTLGQRYTIAWYIDHFLAILPALALLGGQSATLASALRAEIAAGRRLRTSLDLAEAMAQQRDLGGIIERLLAGALEAVGADRASLMSLEGSMLHVEASIDRTGTPIWAGHTIPTGNFRVDGVPVVDRVIETRQPVASGAYDTKLLTPDHAATVRDVRHYLTWPLVLGGEVDAVLFLARRRDRPFTEEETAIMGEFASIAALLLRNGRLLRSAEAASIAKGNFLNLAAHELRTPVSVIRGYLDLLRAGDLGVLSDSQRGVVGTLAAKAEELAQQVEQLLVASRLEQPLRSRADRDLVYDLLRTVHEAVDRARARAALVGARIDVSGAGTRAAGAPGEMALVLDNLINNAITYSRGKPWIEIEVGERDGAVIRPYVRIRDRGIGIAPEDAERVFDRFQRVDRPDFAYPGGTGLGLFIARQLAVANGGSLELEWSKVDEGSCFLLRARPAASSLDARAEQVPA